MRKKVIRKIQIGKAIVKEQGGLGLTIRSLQYVQKKTPRYRNLTKSDSIDTRAKYDEILKADPNLPANEHWPGIKGKKALTFNWLMPPPGKGSGGHMTLFRFIKAFEEAGHSCRIYFFNPAHDSSVEGVRAIMGDSFPIVEAPMEWLRPNQEMADADGIFATSWETAYSVYCSKVAAKKFYFVQDFEPYFYPVGSFSVLAENTYKLGLRGVTAGNWLATKLHDEYGMTTDAFEFGSDSGVYHYDNKSARKEIMFYARPYTERRGFELGVLALDLFHKKHPDYTINFIGWDVSEYTIPFPYNNLKVLEHNELNDLYNRCAAGLVMSLTNMSLLPLELLSSGCIPVVNEGPNNHLVSDNAFIAFTESNPIALAERLSQIVTSNNQKTHAQNASASVQNCSWDQSTSKLVKTVEQSVRTAGSK